MIIYKIRKKMKFLKLTGIMLVMLGLFGCAAKGPAYSAYTQNDAATIDGTFANMFTILFGSEANIIIFSIDKKRATGSMDEIKVSPSKEHDVVVYSNTVNDTASGTIKVQLEARHKYQLRAKDSGDFFTIYLFDITNSEEGQLIKEYKINSRGYNPALSAML